MLSLKELENLLVEEEADFAIVSHENPILTVQEGEGIFGKGVTPTYIVETERGYLALVLRHTPGKLPLREMGESLGYAKFVLAAKAKVPAVTGYSPGAVPLIGHGLPCVFDRKLLIYPYIFGGTGDVRHTLKIAPADVARLNHVLHYIE